MIWKNGLKCANCGRPVSPGRGCSNCRPIPDDAGKAPNAVPGDSASSPRRPKPGKFNWNLQGVDEYDEKVVSLAGSCDPEGGVISIKVMHGGSSTRLWQVPPEANSERSGGTSTVTLPIPKVGQVLFSHVERTKTVRSGESVTEKKVHAFQVAVRVGQSPATLTLFEGLDFLQARVLTEKLCRACDVDIADKTGDKLVLRKRDDIDRPLFETMEKPKPLKEAPSGLEWGKVPNGWAVEWSESITQSIQQKGDKTLVLAGGLLGLVLIAALFLDGVAWSALFVSVLGGVAMILLGISGRRFLVGPNSVTYSEGPAWKPYFEHSFQLGVLEQIHLAAGAGSWGDSDSVSLVSDKAILTVQGTGGNLPFVKNFLESAIFELKRGGGALPPKTFPPYGIKGGVARAFGFMGMALPILAGIVFLWGLLISSARDPLLGLDPVRGTVPGVFSGSKEFVLDAHGYEGKVSFAIPNSWGAEGDFDYKFSILEPDGTPVITLDNEYYLEEWYEESMVSTVSKTVFGFGLPESGKFVLSAEVRVDPSSKDLLGKARSVTVSFLDYRYPYRLALFFGFAALFALGMSPTPVGTVMSCGIRIGVILFLLYLVNWAVFTTTEPEVSIAPRGTVIQDGPGHTGVHVHLYRPYTMHHRGFFSGRGAYGRGSFGGGGRGGRGFRSGAGGK